MNFRRLLLAGFLASVLAHGAGSAIFAENPDDVQIAASKGGGVSVIGSIEDLVAGANVNAVEANEPLEEIQPVEELLEPVSNPVAAKPIKTPVQVAVTQPIKTLQKVSPTTPVTATLTAPIVQGVTSKETVTAKEITLEKAAEPAKTSEPVKQVSATEPVVAKPIELAKAVQPEIQQAQKVIAEVHPVETAPLKEVLKTPAKKPEKRVKKQEKAKSTKAAKKGAKTNARKGGERVTSKKARSNANGRADAKTNDGGTKARSNYKGKVVAKLRRAKRYPKKARRGNLSGTARVSFTISQSGSVSGVRLARSSGHAILDTAALDMVRRASPMPKFPSDIKRSKMTLQVPVRFDR